MFDSIRAQYTSAWFFFSSSLLNQLRHSLYRCELNRSCKNAIEARTLQTVIRMPISIGLQLYKSLACRDVELSMTKDFCQYVFNLQANRPYPSLRFYHDARIALW